MKHLKLWLSFVRASLKADLEYRANFIIRVFTDIFWYLSQITIFEVIFLHTNQLGTWDITQTRIFLGLLFVVDAIYMMIFHDNLERMSDRVRKGDLDMLLTKPASSQFLISLEKTATALIGNFIIATGYLTWSLIQYDQLQPARLLWLIILIPCGIIALYSVRFCISTLALIFVRAENIQYIWYQLYRLGMRPDQIYQPWLRVTVWTLIPVGLVASMPSHFIFDGFRWDLFLITLSTAIGFLLFSQWFWKLALKYYSSASS